MCYSSHNAASTRKRDLSRADAGRQAEIFKPAWLVFKGSFRVRLLRNPMTTPMHRSLIGLAALLGLTATQACSSSTNDSGSTLMGGASGIAHAGSAGSGVSGGGSALAGTGGAPTAGSGAGGASAGSGSSVAGSGGASGGSGAGSGGSSGSAGAGSAVTFAQIKTLVSTSCATGTCHNKASKNLDYQGTTDLHTLLTTVIPAGSPHCAGSTPVKPGEVAGSFLLAALKGGTACPVGGGSIGRMPDLCAKSNSCLTDAQIKMFSDWIAAGAPG